MDPCLIYPKRSQCSGAPLFSSQFSDRFLERNKKHMQIQTKAGTCVRLSKFQKSRACLGFDRNQTQKGSKP